jgi:hypothetical protein
MIHGMEFHAVYTSYLSFEDPHFCDLRKTLIPRGAYLEDAWADRPITAKMYYVGFRIIVEPQWILHEALLTPYT